MNPPASIRPTASLTRSPTTQSSFTTWMVSRFQSALNAERVLTVARWQKSSWRRSQTFFPRTKKLQKGLTINPLLWYNDNVKRDKAKGGNHNDYHLHLPRPHHHERTHPRKTLDEIAHRIPCIANYRHGEITVKCRVGRMPPWVENMLADLWSDPKGQTFFPQNQKTQGE